MSIRTYGTMGVDWEQRVDFDRLREERLARAKSHLRDSELGALLCFDMNNIRYLTATHIGTWAMDKLIRFALLPQAGEPILWDFGSAARHHKLYCPWLGEERSRAGISTLRGAMSRAAPSRWRRRSAPSSTSTTCSASRSASTWSSRRCCWRCRPRGSRSSTGRQLMQEARDDQDPGRDHAPRDGVLDGRRRLRRALPRDAPRHPRERVRRHREPGPLRAWAPSTSRA